MLINLTVLSYKEIIAKLFSTSMGLLDNISTNGLFCEKQRFAASTGSSQTWEAKEESQNPDSKWPPTAKGRAVFERGNGTWEIIDLRNKMFSETF